MLGCWTALRILTCEREEGPSAPKDRSGGRTPLPERPPSPWAPCEPCQPDDTGQRTSEWRQGQLRSRDPRGCVCTCSGWAGTSLRQYFLFSGVSTRKQAPKPPLPKGRICSRINHHILKICCVLYVIYFFNLYAFLYLSIPVEYAAYSFLAAALASCRGRGRLAIPIRISSQRVGGHVRKAMEQ